MRLREITENMGAYEGLEDDDQFHEGCIYCGLGHDVTDIIDFAGEQVCVDCIEEQPMYDWLKHDEEAAIQKLWRLVEDKLGEHGQAFGIGDIEVRDNRIYLSYEVPVTPAHVRYYKSPEVTADILAARVLAARKAAENAAATARGW